MNSLYLHLLCIVLLLLMVGMNRLGLMDPRLPLIGIAIALLGWLLVAVYSVYTLYQQVSLSLVSVMTMCLSLLVLVLWGALLYSLQRVPAIYDISTDIHSPPAFKYTLAQRIKVHNSPRYVDSYGRLQQVAYPHIRPLILALPPQQTLLLAKQLVEDMQWQLHHVDAELGLIEAYARSPWMGFVDDIVIRISALEPDDDNELYRGSRVDMRSASRIGQSDFGANAKRIDRFLEQLDHLASLE